MASDRPVDLTTTICGITFKNPVWTASGCCGYGREFAEFFPLSELGAICVKGTSTVPWLGNKGTRVVETPGGMLNAIGLQNPGIDYFLKVDWPWLQEQRATVIVNIVGRTVEEYAEVAARLEGSGVAAVELNISCPNVKEGGLAFGTSLKGAAAVTAAVRRATTLPLMVKLSPNVTNIVDFARAVEDAGAGAVTVINALLGMSIDIRRRRPHLGNIFGGLSGPAIKPVALRMVWQVAGAVKIPVVGIGGIITAEDAVEFIMAGAKAVQIGSGAFVNPRAPVDLIAGLAGFMREQGFGSVAEMVGVARPATGAEGYLPKIGDGDGSTGRAEGMAWAPGGAPPLGSGAPAPAAQAPAAPAPGAGPSRATGAAGEALRQFLKDSDRA